MLVGLLVGARSGEQHSVYTYSCAKENLCVCVCVWDKIDGFDLANKAIHTVFP